MDGLRWRKITWTGILACVLLVCHSQAQTFSVVANFNDVTDAPSSLIQGADGNFYGTAPLALALLNPLVFKITPEGALTTLCSLVGSGTFNQLMQAGDGNFYGTTSEFSVTSYGIVFRLTPSGTLTTLHNFMGSDGSVASGSLIQAADGNFYGTTTQGGLGGLGATGGIGAGTIFKMTAEGVLTTVHSFDVTDGASPNGVIQAADGNFYGTTQDGGGSSACPGASPPGCGTIFKMTPGGALTTLYAFSGAADGALPLAGLIQGADGNFYGSTTAGGVVEANCPGLTGIPKGCGTIFKITPTGSFTTLHAFDHADGAFGAILMQAKDGSIYGVTGVGGTGNSGTIFTITSGGSLTTLHSFQAGTDGSEPDALLQASDGNLYGTTAGGGADKLGTLFKFSPASPDAPAIAPNGISNGASFQPVISADSWITIDGANLSSRTDTWSDAIVNGALPQALDGVSVMVGGEPAYIEYVSPTQINALAPSVPQGTVPVTVTNSNGISPAVNAQIQAVQPAFFQWGNYAVATRQDFSLAVKNGTFPGATTAPAKPGDVIILWGTGFGPTSPSAPTGFETPSGTTYNTASAVSVKLGTTPATVYGAALAPGYAGLYQIAIQIPASLADGDYPIVATISGERSPSTTLITVQQ